jgi:hypothetical protein
VKQTGNRQQIIKVNLEVFIMEYSLIHEGNSSYQAWDYFWKNLNNLCSSEVLPKNSLQRIITEFHSK